MCQGLDHFTKESVLVRRPLRHFVAALFNCEKLLASRPALKLEDQFLSAVRVYVFNIFAATLHSWRPSPPSATRGRTVQRWQGTHLTRFPCLRLIKLLFLPNSIFVFPCFFWCSLAFACNMLMLLKSILQMYRIIINATVTNLCLNSDNVNWYSFFLARFVPMLFVSLIICIRDDYI
jgi:hypothetical protein